ncbi:hypothetical protein ACTZWW_17630 [Salinarimonas sp. NSM]
MQDAIDDPPSPARVALVGLPSRIGPLERRFAGALIHLRALPG